MVDNSAYDISAEFDSVEKLDEVQKKLEERRLEHEEKKKEEQRQASQAEDESHEDDEAKKEAERKRREAAKAKREKELREQAKREREEALAASPWVTSRHKVRQTRIELLDKVYLRMKADDAFVGSKQEFYDEGLALLEEKYGPYATK